MTKDKLVIGNEIQAKLQELEQEMLRISEVQDSENINLSIMVNRYFSSKDGFSVTVQKEDKEAVFKLLMNSIKTRKAALLKEFEEL